MAIIIIIITTATIIIMIVFMTTTIATEINSIINISFEHSHFVQYYYCYC